MDLYRDDCTTRDASIHSGPPNHPYNQKPEVLWLHHVRRSRALDWQQYDSEITGAVAMIPGAIGRGQCTRRTSNIPVVDQWWLNLVSSHLPVRLDRGTRQSSKPTILPRLRDFLCSDSRAPTRRLLTREIRVGSVFAKGSLKHGRRPPRGPDSSVECGSELNIWSLANHRISLVPSPGCNHMPALHYSVQPLSA